MLGTHAWLTIVAATALIGRAAQGQSITWNGPVVRNNSLVSLSAVPNRISSSAPPQYPLVCKGITGGQWYEPNGVLFRLATPDPVTLGGYGQRNVSGGVELYRGSPDVFPHGVQCCTNTTITLCVGMYTDLTLAASVSLAISNVNNYALSVAATYGPNITGGVQFQLLTPTNVDPPVFQLTCTSTSSPPTDVLWTTNGSPVSNTSSQIVTDRPTSTYNNTLTVTGRAYGMYTCTVTTTCSPVCGAFTLNPRSTTSSLTVQAPPGPPTGVTAVQSGPTSVSVSWTAPISGGPVTRYDIYYVANGGPSTSGGSTNSTSYVLTNLQVGAQYNISVIALGTYLGSQNASAVVVVPAIGQVTITGSVTTPTAGSPHTLTCSVPVNGYNGMLTIQLTAPNGSMLLNNMLSASPGMNYTLQWPFSPLHTSDGGVYMCMVLYENYTLGAASLSVTVTIPPPNVTISAVPSQVVIAGSNITLVCNVQLDPSVDSTVMVTSTWTAPGGATISGSNPLWIGSSNQSTLMLTSLGTRDAGSYVCGVSVASINTLYITGPTGSNASILVSVHTINISTSGSPVAGQMYTLTCTGRIVGDTSLTPVVTWYSSAGVVTNGNDISVSNGDLKFNPLRTSHRGLYNCTSTLRSPFSSTTATEMNIIVQIPPPTVTITSTPITTSYYAGTPLNLTCTVQLIPQVDTNVIFNSLWTGPGGQISSGIGRVSLSSGVNQTTVQFYPLNTTDTGVYNCSVSVSASGQQYVDTLIAVSSSMKSITVEALPAPQVTITPSGSSTAGSPYNLTCTVMVVNGLVVVPQVMWFKNGTSVIGSNGISLTPGMLSANTTTLSLQFNPLNTSNGGQYSCTANVSLPAISITRLYALSSARVIIQIPPPLVTTTAVPSQVVMEEDNITLTCHVRLDQSVRVDSTVMINIEWVEPGGARVNGTSAALVSSTYTDYTLHLQSVVLQESGVYTCRVLVTSEYTTSANVNTSIEVAVYSISIVASSSTTLGGMNYSLTCIVDTYRSIVAPNVAWVGPYGPVTNGNNAVIRDLSAAGEWNVTVFFNPLRTSHGGRYTCVSMVTAPAVTNVTASKDIKIQILPPTVTITSTPLTTLYYAGTPLNLTCNVQVVPEVDTPIIATWLRGASIITSDNYTTISPLISADSSYVTTLIFNPLGTSDSGQYNCNVSVQPGAPYVISGVGGGSLFLQVLDLPAPNVTITPSLPLPSIGAAYSLTCQVTEVAGLVLPIALTWTRADGLSLGTIPVRNGSTTTLSFPSWSALNLAQYDCTADISLPYKGINATSTASAALKAPGVVSGPALATPSDSSSVISWSPPQLSNGRLTGYALSIVQLLDYGMPVSGSAINATVDVMMTSYNWSALNPAVPYQTCISAVNPLGPGDPWCKVFFTKEDVPSVAPMGLVVTRSPDGLSMSISWSPLTLSQARGFVDYYAISYGPVGQLLTSTTTTNGTNFVVSGLSAVLAYNVAVRGHTIVGVGPIATMIVMSVPTAGPTAQTTTASSSLSIAPIAGAIGGVAIGILAVVAMVVIIIVLRSRRKRTHHINEAPFHVTAQETEKQHIKLTDVKASTDVATLDATRQDAMDGSVEQDMGEKLLPPDASVTSSREEVPDEEGTIPDPPNNSSSSSSARDPALPINVVSFHEHVRDMHLNKNLAFQLEYHLLPVKPSRPQKVAALLCNAARSRFTNILPWPTENTIADFWRMVWEGRLQTIVMLTKCSEDGKSKCEMYWPDSMGGVYETDTLQITTISILPFADFDIRKFNIKNKVAPDAGYLQVTHFHYTAWPDHGVPQFATSLLSFVRRVQKAHDKGKGIPLLVHCSAGVGRTGTFIALDTLLDRMRSETSISVFEVVKDMRRRRVLMVQTQDQYVFIHDALDEYITCGDTGISTMNGFLEQFSLLDMVSRKPSPGECSDGEQPYNKAKNRYENWLPYNASRPFLRATVTEGSDYINASFIDGYKQRKGYIATQGPLQNTVDDFWRMVWEFKCKVIIMLCHLTEEGRESSYCYWPIEEGSAMSYGSISVTLESTQNFEAYKIRKFMVMKEKVELMDTLTRTQMSTGNKPIVVHCNDGVGRTGTFITMHSELERLKTEGVVDVVQRVKFSRIARPGIVQNVEQFSYCHECLAQYVDSFDAYANFKELA
eukprot:Em0017g860a